MMSRKSQSTSLRNEAAHALPMSHKTRSVDHADQVLLMRVRVCGNTRRAPLWLLLLHLVSNERQINDRKDLRKSYQKLPRIFRWPMTPFNFFCHLPVCMVFVMIFIRVLFVFLSQTPKKVRCQRTQRLRPLQPVHAQIGLQNAVLSRSNRKTPEILF